MKHTYTSYNIIKRSPFHNREVLVGDVVRACWLERAAAAADAALQCLFQMAADLALQVQATRGILQD